MYLAYCEDDEYYDGAEEWCGDDGDGYPEGNGVSDHEFELEDNDGDGGSGKVDERFLIDAFLKASGTSNMIWIWSTVLSNKKRTIYILSE